MLTEVKAKSSDFMPRKKGNLGGGATLRKALTSKEPLRQRRCSLSLASGKRVRVTWGLRLKGPTPMSQASTSGGTRRNQRPNRTPISSRLRVGVGAVRKSAGRRKNRNGSEKKGRR